MEKHHCDTFLRFKTYENEQHILKQNTRAKCQEAGIRAKFNSKHAYKSESREKH